MKQSQNTFTAFLAQLGVKHTGTYTEQYFNEHPHKYNLFGLSKMLSDYGVDNAATLIEDKENDITEIETPFIAHFSNDFVVVHAVTDEKVSFIWKGEDHDLPVDKFIEAWDGVILLARSSEKSIEPDYKEHRKTEILNLLKKIGFFSALGLLAVFAYISHSYYIYVEISLLLIVNLAGLYISWLLLLKQMHVQSQYADKICFVFNIWL